MTCQSPHCPNPSADQELRKMPLGPGRWDGHQIICESCHSRRVKLVADAGGEPLLEWQQLKIATGTGEPHWDRVFLVDNHLNQRIKATQKDCSHS